MVQNRRQSVFSIQRSKQMAEPRPAADEYKISRDRLAELLNEDLSREYQAIISYVVYSQVLSGAEWSKQMAEPRPAADEYKISRERLAELLNKDLSREYQAIISYVVYSQVLSGAEYMDIAAQLEIHAKQELDHALIITRQTDDLGKMPAVTPKPVRTSKDPKEMLRYAL